MSDLINQIALDLKKQIEAFHPEIAVREIGTVVEAGDGIARVSGLADVHAQELVLFENGVMGIAFNLEKDSVGVIIMGEYSGIEEWSTVRSTGLIASVPVGEGLIGRVITPLGQPIDGRGSIQFDHYRPIERIAPGVVERKDVDTPVETGIKAIDSMTPIGRGQRELIIGDRQTGKTAIAIDTIINQKGKDMICIYVAIGQKKAQVARTVALLEQLGAMEYTVVVVASADDPAAVQYIAPYAGCAIGEEVMARGQDALVIYDDLSKHAWAYRQVSLLLRRPPGREAYPGDVFYLHSRLLERAARLADHYVIVPQNFKGKEALKGLAEAKDAVDEKLYHGPLAYQDGEEARKKMEKADGYKIVKVYGSGGSLTALPIIETLLGDVSAYISTNVISITDGQIYLENNLFYAGVRPAINVGLSVSRVGGAAQTKAVKQVAGGLRMNMAAFRELAAFAQFGSDLDKATQAQLNRGQHLQELLKQPQYEPVSMEKLVMAIYAGTRAYTDNIPLNQMKAWETSYHRYMTTTHPEIGKDIAEKKRITEETEDKLQEAIKTFNATWK